MTGKRKIAFVTSNLKKLEEFRAIVGDGLSFEIAHLNIELPELQGEPEEIAKKKCAYAANIFNGPVIIEDTSLCFNALNELPGPYMYVLLFQNTMFCFLCGIQQGLLYKDWFGRACSDA